METINFVSAPQKILYFTVWLTWQLTEFEARFELAVFIAWGDATSDSHLRFISIIFIEYICPSPNSVLTSLQESISNERKR